MNKDKEKPKPGQTVISAAEPPQSKPPQGWFGRVTQGVGSFLQMGATPEIQDPEDLKTDNTSTTIIVVVVLLALLAGVYFITKKK